MNFYLNSICPFVRGGYYEYRSYNVESIPIKSNPEQQKKLEELGKELSQNYEKLFECQIIFISEFNE